MAPTTASETGRNMEVERAYLAALSAHIAAPATNLKVPRGPGPYTIRFRVSDFGTQNPKPEISGSHFGFSSSFQFSPQMSFRKKVLHCGGGGNKKSET